MVDITPAVPVGRQLINGYGDGGFRISGVRYEGSVLVFSESTIAWAVDPTTELTVRSFDPLFAAGDPPKVLLVGTGVEMRLLDPSVRAHLRDRGVVADVMGTGAACRTFNVLQSEERDVAAALIAVT